MAWLTVYLIHEKTFQKRKRKITDDWQSMSDMWDVSCPAKSFLIFLQAYEIDIYKAWHYGNTYINKNPLWIAIFKKLHPISIGLGWKTPKESKNPYVIVATSQHHKKKSTKKLKIAAFQSTFLGPWQIEAHNTVVMYPLIFDFLPLNVWIATVSALPDRAGAGLPAFGTVLSVTVILFTFFSVCLFLLLFLVCVCIWLFFLFFCIFFSMTFFLLLVLFYI